MLSVMGGSTPERGATAPAPAGPSAARDLNTTRVVSLLRDGGPLTQAELIRRSGLARPTVTAIIRDLLLRRVVVAAGRDTLGGQRTAGCVAGVRPPFGDRGCRPGAARADRDLGRRQRGSLPGTPTPFVPCRHRPLDWDSSPERSAQLALDLGLSRPRSIGMLLVGRHDPSTGLCAGPALGAEPVPLTTLEERLGAAVTVLNPTAAAALGVARSGRHSDAVVIFLDRGIGAGIVCGGQVLIGGCRRRGRAGSLPAARCDGALPVRSLRMSGDGRRGLVPAGAGHGDPRSAHDGAVDAGRAGGP